MIEIERFFGGVLKEQQSIKYDSDIVLLSGPNHCGKSSLLFQYGYTYAKEGYSVLFICNKKKFLSSLPSFPEGLVKDDFILSKIKIKYIENDIELRNYIMDFPMLSFLPDLILIDDLSFYFGPTLYERNTVLGKTISFIKETLSYIKKKKVSLNNNNNNNSGSNSSGSNSAINNNNDNNNKNNNNNNNNNSDNNLNYNKSLDCKVIISDSSTTSGSGNDTSITSTATPIGNTQGTIVTSGHPRFLYIIQRWINFVLIINEIPQHPTQLLNQNQNNNNQQQQQPQQSNQTTPKLPSFNNFNLTVLKYNNNNINNFKDYIINYTLKYFGSNNQNNTYVVENIQNIIIDK